MSKRTRHDFAQFATGLGIPASDAAKRVLEEERQGRRAPRWMRRAARAITRRG